MDISKLNNIISTDTSAAGLTQRGQVQQVQNDAPLNRNNGITDRVSLDSYGFRSDESRFAKTELDKLGRSSFDNVRAMKTQLMEYEAASKISPEAAAATEFGAKLNNPQVWTSIAERILNV
jgi:hypothetical protein